MGIERQALKSWAEIMRALATSPDTSDRKIAGSINQYLGRMPAVQAIRRERAQQRELPRMSRSSLSKPAMPRSWPDIER